MDNQQKPIIASNGWNEWSKYVLMEIERLNREIDFVKRHTTESDVSGAKDKRSIETIEEDIKELFIEVSTIKQNIINLRISEAKQIGLGTIGGIIVTAILNGIVYLIKQ